MLFLICLFSDFFEGIPQIYNNNNSRIILISNNYYIFSCFFSHLSSSSNGGAIFFELMNSIQTLIESSSFYRCNSINIGGALYFNGNNSNLILYKSIGSYCFSLNDQFSRIISSINKKSSFLCSTFNNNNNNVIDCRAIFSFYYHKNEVLYNNISKNYLNFYSSIHFRSFDESDINFTHFSGNLGTKWMGIGIISTKLNIFKTDFYNNSQTQTTWGMIFLGENNPIMNINFCNFLNNTNFLFEVKTGLLTINNSYIQTHTNIGNILIFKSIQNYYSYYQSCKFFSKFFLKIKLINYIFIIQIFF